MILESRAISGKSLKYFELNENTQFAIQNKKFDSYPGELQKIIKRLLSPK